MYSFRRSIQLVQKHGISNSSNLPHFSLTRAFAINSGSGFSPLDSNSLIPCGVEAAKFVGHPVSSSMFRSLHSFASRTPFGVTRTGYNCGAPSAPLLCRGTKQSLCQCGAVVPHFSGRCMSTGPDSAEPSSSGQDDVPDFTRTIKFKRLDKVAGHIMKILDKEAVEEVKSEREVPDIQPGYIVELKVVVPENKRRVSIIKGIVIARHNAGLNTNIRIRRLVAGVGVESLIPLYSPNIKEIKVLEKKKVRRAKLYYLRDKMNALKKN